MSGASDSERKAFEAEALEHGCDCTWTQAESGSWETGCGRTFLINEGTPIDNGMAFCCYCGGALYGGAN